MLRGIVTIWPGRAIVATWPGRLFALLVVVVLVAGVTVVQRVTAAPERVEFRTANVTRSSVTQTVAVSGSVNALAQTKLNFKSAGRLAEVDVTVGQQVKAGDALAKLDTTDLATALGQAQSSLASAQANYNKTLQSAADARRSLDETIKITQNDLTAAQQSLAKLKTNYKAAEVNASGLGTAVNQDIGTYLNAIQTAQTELNLALADVGHASNTAEGQSTYGSLLAAQNALGNALNSATSLLSPALTDYLSIVGSLTGAAAQFENQINAGLEPTLALNTYLSAQALYAPAASRLAAAFDTPQTNLTTTQTAVLAAQSTLNSTTAIRQDHSFDQGRIDVTTLLGTLVTTLQVPNTAKARIAQIAIAVATLTDAVSGGYLSAVQNVTATQERGNQSLQSAQSSVASNPFNVAAAAAGLDAQQLAVQTAQTNLDNGVLRAPSPGTVAQINSQVGEFVSGGGTTTGFILLANTAQVALHGTIGEADVAKLKLGQVANVTVDAVGTGTRMTGKVTSIDPLATLQQGVPVYSVDVTIDVPNAAVKPGMTGTAGVIITSKSGVLTVPNLAIRSGGGRRFVQVLKNGQAVDTNVTFGIANETLTEVVSGLGEGDQVILPTPRAPGTSGGPIRVGGPGF